MIATIEGKISEKIGGQVIVNVQGVGYGMYVTPEDSGKLQIGEETKLYVHEHIRENSHDLFGFSEVDTKNLFEQLLSVSGVGPKMALAILSVGKANEVRSAIADGDTKSIQAAPGVGRKVAERVVVDLKDKVGISGQGSERILKSGAANQKDEAVQALVALGLNVNDALERLDDVEKGLPVEERVKQALKG